LGIFVQSFYGGVRTLSVRVSRQHRLSFLLGRKAFYFPFLISWAKCYRINPLLLFLGSLPFFCRFGSLSFSSPYWLSALGSGVRTQVQLLTPGSLAVQGLTRTFGRLWPAVARFATLRYAFSQWLVGASVRLAQRRRLHSRFLLPLLFGLRHRPNTPRLISANLFNFALYDHSYIHYSVGRYKRLKNKRRARFRLR